MREAQVSFPPSDNTVCTYRPGCMTILTLKLTLWLAATRSAVPVSLGAKGGSGGTMHKSELQRDEKFC